MMGFQVVQLYRLESTGALLAILDEWDTYTYDYRFRCWRQLLVPADTVKMVGKLIGNNYKAHRRPNDSRHYAGL